MVERPHTRPDLLLAVAVGGFIGTATRYLVARALPTGDGQWPTATLVVNLVGAFILGALLEGLTRHGPDVGWRRRVRFGVGTGFCGALTTYSALAIEVDLLARDDRLGLAAAYAVISLLAGLAATVMGVAVAARNGPAVVDST